MPLVIRASLMGLVLTVGLVGCSNGATTSSTVPTAASASTVAATSTTAFTSAAASASSSTAAVSANTATEAELVAVLQAAGAPNAERWAREVMEYRPYPADDPTLQKLQDNLAKYVPDPATLAAILHSLTP